MRIVPTSPVPPTDGTSCMSWPALFTVRSCEFGIVITYQQEMYTTRLYYPLYCKSTRCLQPYFQVIHLYFHASYSWARYPIITGSWLLTAITPSPAYGAFTLTETETETDKMGLKPIDICHCICLGQYEHLHTIPYNPFFIGRSLYQCEHTLTLRALGQNFFLRKEDFCLTSMFLKVRI